MHFMDLLKHELQELIFLAFKRGSAGLITIQCWILHLQHLLTCSNNPATIMQIAPDVLDTQFSTAQLFSDYYVQKADLKTR
jgi:hypothetical protein